MCVSRRCVCVCAHVCDSRRRERNIMKKEGGKCLKRDGKIIEKDSNSGSNREGKGARGANRRAQH